MLRRTYCKNGSTKLQFHKILARYVGNGRQQPSPWYHDTAQNLNQSLTEFAQRQQQPAKREVNEDWKDGFHEKRADRLHDHGSNVMRNPNWQ